MGGVLLEDAHLIEKLARFDRMRIPERVVHPRGVGAHGIFKSYGNFSELTKASVFYLKGVAPPDVTMKDIYASVIPYVLVTLLGVLLIILFPGIALYLPSVFFN